MNDMNEHEAHAILELHRLYPLLVKEAAVIEALVVLGLWRQAA
jgi:hypothetical protein